MVFSRHDPGNQANELLVVSSGTSCPEGRLTIGAIENALGKAFPEYQLRRCFTSQAIIDLIQRREGVQTDNVTQALERAAASGVRNLTIQPTHLISGGEYGKLIRSAAVYRDAFSSFAIGAPLLSSQADFHTVARALAFSSAPYDNASTAVCLVGHGTEAAGKGAYARLQQELPENYFIGALNVSPTAEDILSLVQAGSYHRVLLRPLMIVAGKHARDDVAGARNGSWRHLFENAGYPVVCQLSGLGELEAIQALLVRHAREAMKE